jgi:hypothetical protein
MRLGPSVLLFLATAVACDHWPGVSEGGDGGGPNPAPTGSQPGTCSGTPLPCSALTGADCINNAGCMDHGTCSGTPSISGEACGGELSYQSCIGIPGCFWAPNCIGTPYGNCSAITEMACLVAKGCVFTPAGAGGTSNGPATCNSFQSTCTKNIDCDCGFACIAKNGSSKSSCGIPCLSDLDCATASDGAGNVTPYCKDASTTGSTPMVGMCSATR